MLPIFHLMRSEECSYEKFRTITCTKITTEFLFSTGLFTAKHMYRQFICIDCNLGMIPSYTFNVKDNEGDRAAFIILDLTGCNVTGLEQKSFYGQDMLRKLILRENSIVDVEGMFATLKHMEFLDLAYNKIETLKENGFSGLLHLSILNLEGNRITEIENKAFSDLENLQILKLDRNRIKHLNGDVLSGLLAIESLSLRYNFIDSMNYEALSNFSYLLQLDLENNGLKEIPLELLNNGKSLKQLDISSNPLQMISSRALTSDSLEELYIRNCSLPMVKNLFVNLPNLRILDISSNVLTDVNLENFSKLKYLAALNLSSNSINHIGCSNSSLSSLRNLDLSNNNIADFDYVCIIGNLPELKGISFMKNPLPSYLQKEIIEYLYGMSSSFNNTSRVKNGSEVKEPPVLLEKNNSAMRIGVAEEGLSLEPFYVCFGVVFLILAVLLMFLYKLNVSLRELDNAVKGSTVPLLDV